VPILLSLVLYVVVEVAAAVAVAAWIGVGWTLLLLLGLSLLGLVLLRREGARAWRSFSAAVAEGRPPGREAMNGMLVLVGALLIIVPGFVTDVLALLCLLPFSRKVIGRVLVGWALTRGRATVVRVRASRGPAGTMPPGPPGPAMPPGTPDPPGRGRVIDGEIEPPRE
jgi:UPF0716 protein FxsA